MPAGPAAAGRRLAHQEHFRRPRRIAGAADRTAGPDPEADGHADTIYAEGRRRHAESLSAHARRFLELLGSPTSGTA